MQLIWYSRKQHEYITSEILQNIIVLNIAIPGHFAFWTMNSSNNGHQSLPLSDIRKQDVLGMKLCSGNSKKVSHSHPWWQAILSKVADQLKKIALQYKCFFCGFFLNLIQRSFLVVTVSAYSMQILSNKNNCISFPVFINVALLFKNKQQEIYFNTGDIF